MPLTRVWSDIHEKYLDVVTPEPTQEAEIHVEDGKLIVTGEAFLDSKGCVRMWGKEDRDITGNQIRWEVPLGWLIKENVGFGQQLTITVEVADMESKSLRGSPD